MWREKHASCVLIWPPTRIICVNSLCYVSYNKSLLFPKGCTEENVGNLSQTIFAITGEDSFLSACFFPTSSLKPFLGNLFSFVFRFSQIVWKYDATLPSTDICPPNNNNLTYLPPSCHHSFPQTFCYLFQIPAKSQWLIIIYFIVCGTGIFQLSYCSLPQIFLGYCSHKLRSESHILWNFKSWQELLWSFYYETALQDWLFLSFVSP